MAFPPRIARLRIFRLSERRSRGTVALMRQTFATWWREMLRRRRVSETRRELLGLSDHRLKDIGLTRAQIDALYR